jgi:hypothetical protein
MVENVMGKNFGNNQSGLILLLFMLVFLVAAAGEDSAGREVKLFNRGYESYLSYQPEKAVGEFTSFLKEFPDSSARDAALYWLGKSYMQMKSFGEARRVFLEIKQNFPGSPYLSHAESELTIISSLEVDAHMVAASESETKNESPEKRLKEAEKKGKVLEKLLKETTEERDRVRAQLNEEEKRTEALREQVEQLEKKEKTLKEVAGERDELRRRFDKETNRRIELEAQVETCEHDVKKMRSGGKELTEVQHERDSLRKLLDDEKKTTADLITKLKEFEKKEKAIKDLAEERDALQSELVSSKKKRDELEQRAAAFGDKEKTLQDIRDENTQLKKDSEKELEEKEKTLTNLRESMKECEEKTASCKTMTASNDELAKQVEDYRGKTDALQMRIQELEKNDKKTPAREESLARISEEKDVLSRNLDEEKQKTALLLSRIKELEAKENLVADIIYERDTLKVQVEEQQRMIQDFQNRPGTTRIEEKPLAVTLPVHEAVIQPEEAKKEEEQREPRREKEQDETEASGDSVPGVLHQLGIQEIPWRSGNSKENEETEKVLYEKARSLNITGDEKTLKDLAAKHGFNAKQKEYLKRYLAVSEYINRRLKSMPEEEVIESLVVTYEEANRYTKIVLSTELQENARQGEPFEEIYKLYPDMMVYKIVPARQLEKQIRDKISSLAHGEVGVIWSEDGYMILKPSLKKLSYEPFNNVTRETEERIKTLVNEWVQELKSP